MACDCQRHRLLRGARVALFCTLSLAAVTAPCRGADSTLEYQVKAGFLLNFTKFTEWRSEAFAGENAPLAICILGDDPFGPFLDQLVEGVSVNGHKVSVTRLKTAPTSKSCQVLFVSKSEKRVPEVLAGIGEGVLTVSDRDGFLGEGGMIAFVIDGSHVRFDVNQRAATKASLTMSARMLNVARNVQK